MDTTTSQIIDSAHSQLRECIVCLNSKPLNDFYHNNGKTESQIRWDRKCKVCKRAAVNEKRGKFKKTKSTRKTEKAPDFLSKGAIEDTHKLVKTLDFADLEHGCDTTLTHAEKHDAVHHFNEFITILREGYAELVGCERVYVLKD